MENLLIFVCQFLAQNVPKIGVNHCVCQNCKEFTFCAVLAKSGESRLDLPGGCMAYNFSTDLLKLSPGNCTNFGATVCLLIAGLAFSTV